MKENCLVLATCCFIFSLIYSCSMPAPKENTFEGEIEYAYSYQSDTLNLDTLKAQRPTSGLMVYRDSMYKSVFIGKNTESYVYDNHTGVAFHLTVNSDSIDCEDYTTAGDTVLNWEVKNTDETILGEPVGILEFSTPNATHRFYYSLQHKTAPYNSDKHAAHNWKFYKEKAGGGVLLKTEHIFKDFTMTGIARRIDVREVAAEEFEIDKSKLVDECL